MAPGTNTSTVVAAASGVDGPINRHATEYNVLPHVDVAVDADLGTRPGGQLEGRRGQREINAAAWTASNTTSGWAPSRLR
jgi:ABC-type thiamine transport system ATPase subunit